MADGVERLTERERMVLRLLLDGHDAKSIAVHLDISVHAVNERLRKARQKLGVGSSRAAARVLLATEGAPNSLVDEKIGLGGAPSAAPGGGRPARPALMLIGAVVMVFLIATAVAFWAQHSPAATTDAAPRVVSTSPAQGSVIPPGPYELSVTFDRPMRAGGMSYTRSSPDTAVDCAFTPHLADNGRTFAVRCRAAPAHRYEVWFNRQPYMNFVSAEGVPAVPYRLRFRTR